MIHRSLADLPHDVAVPASIAGDGGIPCMRPAGRETDELDRPPVREDVPFRGSDGVA